MKRRRGLFQVSREKKAKVAERLRAEGLESGGLESIPRRDDPEHRPLSFAQTRLWFLDVLEPGLTAYNIPALLRLRGTLDQEALAASFGEILRRHEVLRVRFENVEGQPRQHLTPPAPFDLPLVDLAGVAEESREEVAREVVEGSIFQPFDLGRGPLLRVLLLRLAEGEHLALLVKHHIVTDGWSMGVLIRELGELYGSFQRRQSPSLPSLPLDYFDYAVWQQEQLESGPLARQREWWVGQLEDLEPLELATDSPRPPIQTYRGAVVRWRLPGGLKERLEALGRERGGATLFMTLLGAFQLLLYRLSGQRDLAVGTPIANRTRRELEGLIGFFVNTLVLRGRLQRGWSFGELLDHLREVTLAAYGHQDLPFDKVVEAVRPDRDLAQAPLFQVMFALQNTPRTKLRLEGLTLESETIEKTAAMFDLMLNVAEEGDGLLAALVYNADLFSATRARRLLAQLRTLLLAALESPDHRLEDLPLLSSAERQQILVEWNDTGLAAGGSATLHDGFLARASAEPEAIAVRSASGQRTYAELLARAQDVTRWLREAGVGQEDRVAVFHPRTPDLLAALLGTLGSGGSYVPLDPAYPQERIAFMMSDAEVRVVITTSELAPDLPKAAGDARILCLDTFSPDPASTYDPRLWCTAPGQERHVAYTIYTSGSTGRPKGVVIEHRSAVTLLRWARQRFSRRDLAGVLASTSVCFDLSIFEIFLPLAEGGTVILVEDALALLEPDDSLLDAVTLINTVPSAMTELVAAGAVPPGVEVVNLAGEPIKSRLIRDLYAKTEVRKVFNLYGPSEDTTYSTWSLLEPAAGPPPIGRPVGDTRLYLLDGSRNPLPIGVPGEVYLAGAGLARGYLDRRGSTAERFVPDPFASEAGARTYRTGDLARFRPDGELDFLGRNDHQVKIRGYRIELGEIEAALVAHPEIRQAVVSAHDADDSRRLVAHVETSSALDVVVLRTFLGETLPAYMVPASFVFLERLPLTSNGKIDRRALPAPEVEGEEASAGLLANPYEELVAAAFAEVLDQPRIGRDDDFFALGGHSLLATQVVSRLQASLGVGVPLQWVFDASTVRALAARLASGFGGSETVARLPAIEPLGEGEEPPLSFAQERMWFLDRLTPGHPAYHIAATVLLSGELDVPAFHAALAGVVARQTALRHGFAEGAAGPVLRVRPPSVPAFPKIDLEGLDSDVTDRELDRLARAEALRPFDLERGPLLRATLVQLASERHALVLTLHHIVADGWSMGVLLRELGELYRAARGGEKPSLQELPISYSDFAAWQRKWLRGQRLEGLLGWWRDHLRGAPELLELPTDRPRPRIQTWRSGIFHMPLGRELSNRLRSFSRQRGATLFMTLLAGFQAVLARHSGQSDLVVGSPIANRTRGELEGLIGLFVNTLVLRQDLSGDPTFDEHLDRVRETTLVAYAHQDCPFEKLVEALRPQRDMGYTPLFQVMLVLQNAPLEVQLPGLRLEPLPVSSGAAKFDLTVAVTEGLDNSELRAAFEYNRDLFDGSTITRLAGHWRRLLEGAVEGAEQSLSRLPLLSAAEETQLVVEWSSSPAPEPAIASLPRNLFTLFATRAEECPGAVALSGDPGWQMTYGELHRQALGLSARLRREGVAPGDFVGLFLERSPAQVVAMLGVLAAGAAYVPIDPAYPGERVAWIAEDSGFRLLLTDPGARSPLPREIEGLRTAAWDLLASGSREAEGDTETRPELWPEAVAYVIYTSGSTGKPKGSPSTHQNVAALLAATQRQFCFDPEQVFTLFHSYAFDFSIWEIWGALAWGGRVAVVPYEISRSPEELRRLLDRERATVLSQTPSAFQQLVPEMIRAAQEDRAVGSALRHVVFGGEALEPARLAPWFETFGDGSDGGPRLVNMYGITETTVHVTYRPLAVADVAEAERSPVGRVLDHLQTHLLDPHGSPVPAGVVGEIHVGGEGLGHGYLHQPSLTASRFVPSPFGPPGARLYRSGDLARFLPTGEIDFLGRLDHQVKIRGFRIELGEIESALASDPAVADVAVLAHGDVAEEVRLVAYLVIEGEVEGAEARLRAHLGDRLPGYMCPAAYVVLDQLPMTVHGKLDRRALPDPGGARPEIETVYREPETALEIVLCEVWAEALDVEQVGLDDNFFELGGHSLLATRIIAWVRDTLESEIPLTHFFEAPTVVALNAALVADPESASRVRRIAEALLDWPTMKRRRRDLFQGFREKKPNLEEGQRSEGLEAGGFGRIPRRDDPEHRPLSFAQTRLWFLDALVPGLTAYNIPALLRLRGRLDLGALAASFDEILRRHGVLRVRFENVGGQPRQHLVAPAPFDLPLVDLGGLAKESREGVARKVVEGSIFRPIDLRRGPLLRVLLFRLAEDEHLALLVVHHIVTDGWSMGVLIRELGELYGSFQHHRPPSLPALPLEYFDYAVWQHEQLESGPLARQREWWVRQLEGLEPLELATDSPRPPVQTFRGAVVRWRLPGELRGRLEALGRERGSATLFMTLLAAFQLLLYRLSGQRDLAVGTPIANRTRRELEGLIGFFVNTLVLRGRLQEGWTFGELLDHLRGVTLAAYGHQDLPFDKVVEAVRPDRDLAQAPLFQVMLALQNMPRAKLRLEGLTLESETIEKTAAMFDLVLNVIEEGDGLQVALVYNADLFSATRARRLLAQLRTLLQAALGSPDRRLEDLPLLSGAERQQILVEWNDDGLVADRTAQALHSEFLARADVEPETIADAVNQVDTVPSATTELVAEGPPPIGRPVGGTRLYLLDKSGNPLPIGVPGEIYLAGAGLARGYLYRPGPTAERFVPDPFASEAGARIYRTGDLARFRPDGELDFLGRNDQQVKIRGYRIELGEIEAALVALPEVVEAVVLVRDDLPGGRDLVAWVVPRQMDGTSSGTSSEALGTALAKRLPEPMVPRRLYLLEALPLTANGKTNRLELARRPLPGTAMEQGSRQLTVVEEQVATQFIEVLELEGGLSASGHFFELGGQSLVAVRLVSRLREIFGVDLTLRDIFRAPTVSGLASVIEALGLSAAGRVPGAVGDPTGGSADTDPTEWRPLSFAQTRLWILDRLEPGNPAYHLPALLRLRGTLDRRALVASLEEIVGRHGVLRARFREMGGVPKQRWAPLEPLALPAVDLSGIPAGRREETARRIIAADLARPFDLIGGPLLRMLLIRLESREHLALLVEHHIITDDWSIGVLIRELGELYGALRRGRPASLASLPIEYSDHVDWQHRSLAGGELEKEQTWWKEQLEGLEPLELATDFPRSAERTHRGEVVRRRLPAGLKADLEVLGREQGGTPFISLLAGFQLLLSRLSGRRDLAVGAPVPNRTRQELEGLIGLFANTLVLRGRLEPGWTFRQLLDHLREVTVAAFAHQEVPFERVVEAVQPERDLARAPLFQVMLAFRNLSREPLELEGLTLQTEEIETRTSLFDLTLTAEEEDGGLLLVLVYNADLFHKSSMAGLLLQLETLLRGVVAEPDRALESLSLLNAVQRHQMLVEWNDSTSHSAPTTLHGLFAAQVTARPEADALLWRDERLSYAELGRRVRRLAQRLLRQGVGREEPVAICLQRSPNLIVALLGILEAGGVYVPLDPKVPAPRLLTMLEEVGHPLLLTESDLRPELHEGASEVLLLDTLEETPETEDLQPLPAVDPEQLAYIIFTSGSTGRPKGVQVPHRGVVSLHRTQASAFGVEPRSRVLQFASVGFDASILEIIVALGSGAALVLEPAEHLLGESLLEVLRRREIGFALLPPSLLASISPSELPALITLTTGGEAPSAEAVGRWAPGRRFFNLYGPTEATIWSTLARCTGDGEAPPIGHPVLDTRAYVVDRALRPVPVRSPGELVLAGRGVVRGYRGLPGTTAAAFVPDPFGEPGDRLYRTGDLVRRRADGQIEFLGRIDYQVKVRGFRIELGEIEAHLRRLPQVRDALVTAPEIEGDRRLVAYWVPEATESCDSEPREALRRQLPEYMVPSFFVALESMPLTPNGKIDRKALPLPTEERAETEAHVAPRNPLEQQVAEIFEEILGLKPVGVKDHFFDLGGHSLLATRVIALIQQRFGAELPLSLLFQSPTVEALALALEEALADLAQALPDLVPTSRDEPLPLSFGQERLWFLDQLEPGSTAYNLSLVARLRGDLRPAALETALLRVVERHEVLRCRFVARSGRPVLEPFAARVELPFLDLTHLPAEQRKREAERQAVELGEHLFDLAAGDLIRTRLIRIGAEEHLFVVALHHIVTDGWSMGVFLRDLAAYYRAAVEPAAPAPAPLTLQYGDFAAWQRGWLRGETLESHLAWWRESLVGGTEPLALPADFPRPAEQTFRGESEQRILEPVLLDGLHRLGREVGATLFMTLLTAFQLQLGRWSGQRRLSVGVPSAGRGRREIEDLIGFFINTVVLRTDLGSPAGGGLSFRELLARVRDNTLDAFAHQEIPFEKLVAELDPERDSSRTPLFQAFFNLLNLERPRIELPGLELELEAPAEPPSKFDLTLYASEVPKGLHLRLVYNADLFTPERMGAFLDAFTGLLEEVILHPDRPVYQLSLTSGRAAVSAELETSDVQEIVVRPVAAPPVAARRAAAVCGAEIAVLDGRVTWTHRQLHEEAAAVARALEQAGVGRGDGVALAGARNAWLVAAVLGVASVGAVVVILDPELPVARLRQIAEQAGPEAWLQLPEAPEALAELGEEMCPRRMIRLPDDLSAERWSGEAASIETAPIETAPIETAPIETAPIETAPDDLATLTFTSGTTGVPRGVWSTHRPVAVFLEVYRRRFGLGGEDRFALLAGLGHDPLQRDLWTPLVVGARLAVPSAEVLGEPASLWRWVAEGEITVLHLTPSRAEFLLQGGVEGASLPALRLVLFAGETLTTRLARAFARAAPGARLVNTYGATETPQVMAWDEIRAPADLPEAFSALPIGRGREGVEVRVVGPGGETCGVGELGEIQVSSRHLAVGYPGRAARTADRFRPDGLRGSASAEVSARVYCTGDLGRYLPDGRVVVEGRADRQLKVRGFRVEPAEIEAVLAEHGAVARAMVAVRRHPSGDQRLVAYWAAEAGTGATEPEELRSYLAKRLPGFAVPSVFVALESLPLTPGGKADFSALPVPEWRVEAEGLPGRGPSTPTEVSLAAVWEEVLGVEALDVTEDFFALGGHSLLATRLAARIRQVFAVEMPLRQLFRTPTVEGLAAWLDDLRGREDGLAEALPAAVADLEALAEPFPLTDVQQAYWIGRHAALELGNVATHSYMEVECPDLDLPRFEEAWNRLIERHAMLRAVMLSAAEQKILPSVPRYRIHTEDWSGLDAEAAETALAEVREALSHQVLDPQRWPLFELRASRLSGGRIRLHISRDALIYDAWSVVLVLRELLALYLDPGLELKPLEITFRDYVLTALRLEGTAVHERAVRYWQERLDHLPPGPELPLAVDPQALGRPTFERHEGGLSLAAWTRITERSRAAGVSTSVVLLAAWAEVLATWSARPRFTLTLTLFNRLPVHPQVDRLVGDFTSLTLLEIDVRTGESFGERASRIQERLWEDLDHRHVGGIWVLRELARRSRSGPSARMPVVFTSTLGLDRRPPGDQEGRAARDLGEVVYSITQTPQVWLDHQASDNQDGLHFNWDSVHGLFPEGMVDAMFGAYLELLGRLASDESAWSSPGVVLTPAPQLQMRTEVNQTAAPVPAGLLHTPLLEQARRRPEAPAVITPRRTLSFGELERRSADLCHRLRAGGLEPGRLVAVVMHKGWEQVVAALAVLRAGGAYLPIDAALPAERRAHLLERGEVCFAFTQEGLGETLEWSPEVRVIEVTEAEPEVAVKERAEPPDVAREPSDLAYVIFTSGSTGQPKGVMIDHRGALNTCVDVNQRFDVKADDRVLGLSSLGFDLSVYDLFGVLGAGGALVLPENDRRRDPFHWAELVQQHQVTVWNTVPALMDMYCDFLTETGAEAPHRLRLALLSGDWIPVTLPERLWRLVPELRVISLGGATEASIWSILHPIDRVDPEWKSIPYGRPMVNQTFHVLDAAGRPRPEWVPGELYIGGIGVALGYWRDPERTAASFVDHPEQGRLYRTGDLGRSLPGGEIEFLGREDFQVKVGGHRIELGEIEAALLRCTGVKEAVAAAPGEVRGPRRLVAYVVPAEVAPDIAELQQQLASKLPEYMVPKTFVWLEALPLSANGKVDRQQLPEPEGEERAYVPPSGEAEEQIAGAWAEVLSLERIGAEDNFFELGGDSVMAIQVTTRLAARGWRLEPTAVFEHQTVAALAPLLRPLEEAPDPELESAPAEVADEGIDLDGADLSEDDLEELLSGL